MELTDFQRELLQKMVDKGIRYITRDRNGILFWFGEKPRKEDTTWVCGCVDDFGSIPAYLYEEFTNIHWSDEEPFDIKKALGIIDWENIPIDTKVLVKLSYQDEWREMHYAGLEKDGRPLVWDNGKTSWTGNGKVIWENVKLAEECEELEEQKK